MNLGNSAGLVIVSTSLLAALNWWYLSTQCMHLVVNEYGQTPTTLPPSYCSVPQVVPNL